MKHSPELFTNNITFLTHMPSNCVPGKYREAIQTVSYDVYMNLLTKPENK